MNATDLGDAGPGKVGAIWLRVEPERARRATPLTRERIVAEAAELLDAKGIDALTMRRLAERLGVTSTALYWHVRTKDDVLDLAVDHIFGEVHLPGTVAADWRDDVRALTSGWRAAMLRHPWAPGLIGRPMLGPNVLARTEFLHAALVRGGFGGLELAVVTRLLANYVIGAALTEATWRQNSDPRARAQARQHLASRGEDYPTLVATGHLDDGRWDDDELFTRGIDALLGAASAGPHEPAAIEGRLSGG